MQRMQLILPDSKIFFTLRLMAASSSLNRHLKTKRNGWVASSEDPWWASKAGRHASSSL